MLRVSRVQSKDNPRQPQGSETNSMKEKRGCLTHLAERNFSSFCFKPRKDESFEDNKFRINRKKRLTSKSEVVKMFSNLILDQFLFERPSGEI